MRPFERLNRTGCTPRTVLVEREGGRGPFGFDRSEIRPGAIPSDTGGWNRVALVVRHKQGPFQHNEGRGRGVVNAEGEATTVSMDGDAGTYLNGWTVTLVDIHAEQKCDEPSHPSPERTEYLSPVR